MYITDITLDISLRASTISIGQFSIRETAR